MCTPRGLPRWALGLKRHTHARTHNKYTRTRCFKIILCACNCMQCQVHGKPLITRSRWPIRSLQTNAGKAVRKSHTDSLFLTVKLDHTRKAGGYLLGRGRRLDAELLWDYSVISALFGSETKSHKQPASNKRVSCNVSSFFKVPFSKRNSRKHQFPACF